MVGYSETGPRPRWRSEGSLPMIHAVPQAVHLHLNRVHLAVFHRRTERDAVFVADKLCDFGVGAIEFLLILGKIDAPAARHREFAQRFIGLSKALLDERPILPLPMPEFPSPGKLSEVAHW